MERLPIFDIIISEDNLEHGVSVISLVDDPAIGVDWIKLASQETIAFKADRERKLLFGPFLIPNKLIYRRDEVRGEYYIRFSAEEIEKIAYKFNSDLNNNNINLMHSDTLVDGFVAQNWLIEGDQDKSRGLGFDLPEGTWFGGVKIKNDEFWMSSIKNDEVKGFSVEIKADLQLSLKNKENKMEKLSNATLQDGAIIYWDGDLAVGTPLFTDEAMTVPVGDGEHLLENGDIVITVDGAVSEIKPKEVEDMEDEVPTQSVGMTPEEVSQMIDIRFGEIMEEVSMIKKMIEEMKGGVDEFKNQVTEKFSSMPATTSITKPEVGKVDDKFKKMEDRVRDFARK
jgi:hypothetical protein